MNVFGNLDLDVLYSKPVECPVGNCNSRMAPMELLAHLLMRHCPQESMLEINANWPTLYEIELAKLTPGRNHVIAVIAYAGPPNPSRSCPVTPELQIVHHMPMLMLLYITPPEPDVEQAYVFYLVSPTDSRSVNAHVTLIDCTFTHEMRGLRCLRNSLDAPLQNSDRLLHCNTDYLVYTAEDIQKLCEIGKKESIFSKIILYGQPDLFG
ncbi:uncharacterized protein LOC6642250 [Drosophila willistoni]|nr:uncharacterized protein LOC6642250 [Drosophila willistoni]